MEEDVPSRIRAAKEALEKQDFNSAGRHCKHVLKKDRNNDEAYVIFGKALMAQKQRGHAEMAFRKAIACNPAAFPAWQVHCDLGCHCFLSLLSLYEEIGTCLSRTDVLLAVVAFSYDGGEF